MPLSALYGGLNVDIRTAQTEQHQPGDRLPEAGVGVEDEVEVPTLVFPSPVD